MDTNVDNEKILDHFHKGLEILRQLDEESDIKFYDFFMCNYQKKRLFRDSGHPSHVLYRHIVKEIVSKLNINVNSIDDIEMDYHDGHFFRYRHILPCVTNCLGLQEPTNFQFFGKWRDSEELFYFLKSVSECLKNDEVYKRGINW